MFLRRSRDLINVLLFNVVVFIDLSNPLYLSICKPTSTHNRFYATSNFKHIRSILKLILHLYFKYAFYDGNLNFTI